MFVDKKGREPLGNSYESSAFIYCLSKSHYDGWFGVIAHQFVNIQLQVVLDSSYFYD